MKILRRLGQYLGLIYSDDGKWRIGGIELGKRPAPPPVKEDES
jgi:hypothetical protein